MESVAVANPCTQKEWEEWKREMEENRRRRWRERVSRWVGDEMNGDEEDDGEEETDSGGTEGSEEEGESEEVEKVELEDEMKMKKAENIEEEEGGENETEGGMKGKNISDEIVNEADKRMDLVEEEKEKESEVEGEDKEDEEKIVKEAQAVKEWEEEEDEENVVQLEIMRNEEVVEEEGDEVKEAITLNEKEEEQNEVELEGSVNDEVEGKLTKTEVQQEQEERQHEVETEGQEEDEESKVWEDEQKEDGDDGDKDYQEQDDQTGQYYLVEQFTDQMKRTEDEFVQGGPECEVQEDNREDSEESMSDDDFEWSESENTCDTSEWLKEEEQSAEPQILQNLDGNSCTNVNPILEIGTLQERQEEEDSMEADEETENGIFWITQEEKFQDCPTSIQEEYGESTDDEEAAEQSNDEDDDSKDEELVKIYSKNHHPTDIFHILAQFQASCLLTDLTLSTEHGTSFQVHSPVLAAVSSLIWDHLSKRNRRSDDDTCAGVHRWSVSLGPQVDHAGLAAVVEFAYTGIISRLDDNSVQQITTAAETLGVPRVVRLCSKVKEKCKTRGQKTEEMISAAEQMTTSLQSIKQLWMDRVGCDVILEAPEESLHVHRVVLAASSDYFRGMFTSGMRESYESCVALPFLMAPELEVLISCSYSGVLPLSWKCVFETTSTALQLQCQPALSLCLMFLQQEMNPNSCLDVASFAEAYELVQLQEVADDYVTRQFQKVARTSKFKDLPARQLLKYLNSYSLYVPSELIIFKAVVAWIQAKPKRRLRLAKEMMKTIHFPLMTFKEFKEVKSLNIWSDHSLTELYEAIFEDFCSSDAINQSQCRTYLPKESLVLIGGDQISEDLGSRSISRELWFGNSLRNHTGVRKAMEWRSLGEMPEPARFCHEVAVHKGQLYILGGKKYYGISDTLSSVFRYDPLQNHWENLAEMQEKRCSFSVVVLDDKIYALGGYCDPDHINSVEQYCPTANAWSFCQPLDLPLRGHVAKVTQGSIFVSGGQNSDYQLLASLFLYHPESGSTLMSSMITPRAHHCMEALGERLYVAGGISTDNNTTVLDQLTCEVYSPAADTWTVLARLPVPHVGAGSAVLEGKLYVLGGYSQEDYTDTKMVHRYDPSIQRWENMGKMPGPNNDIRAALLCLPTHLRL